MSQQFFWTNVLFVCQYIIASTVTTRKQSQRSLDLLWPFTVKSLLELKNFDHVLVITVPTEAKEKVQEKIFHQTNVTSVHRIMENDIMESVTVPHDRLSKQVVFLPLLQVLQIFNMTIGCKLVHQTFCELFQLSR